MERELDHIHTSYRQEVGRREEIERALKNAEVRLQAETETHEQAWQNCNSHGKHFGGLFPRQRHDVPLPGQTIGAVVEGICWYMQYTHLFLKYIMVCPRIPTFLEYFSLFSV